jgi:hypothetical protein
MRTRRKSKRAAAATVAEPDNERAGQLRLSRASQLVQGRISVPVPDDIDLEYPPPPPPLGDAVLKNCTSNDPRQKSIAASSLSEIAWIGLAAPPPPIQVSQGSSLVSPLKPLLMTPSCRSTGLSSRKRWICTARFVIWRSRELKLKGKISS